ncbi:hypothetical protein BGZ76_010389 [Entomortierella beljakovae]|nr:hypothetical protein BGZ76_010389 [Entomortierella beljakovae]
MSEDNSIDSTIGNLAKGLNSSRRLEIGHKLDQFSKQCTLFDDLGSSEIFSELSWGSLEKATNVIKDLADDGYFGNIVEYQGVPGYNPEHIGQIVQKYRTQEGGELPSKILEVCDMGEYGSGGIPERFRVPYGHCNSSSLIDAECRQYAHDPRISFELKKLQEVGQSEMYANLLLCRAGRSIEVCLVVCCSLEGDISDWLLKVAVHAACTLEGLNSGDMAVSKAILTIFQLSRELGWIVRFITVTDPPSKLYATIFSLLIDVSNGFISAGVCLLFSHQQEEEYYRLMLGLAEHCSCIQSSNARINPRKDLWKKLLYDCVYQTNFCPSRASALLDAHPSALFHFIARCDHLATAQKLHETCDDLCRLAQSVENHLQPGHLKKGCECLIKRFEPIETSELVLFDTVSQQLIQLKSKVPYVAVSQIWFQGIFGQNSRTCGKCSLNILENACTIIGARYVWIDTLCMPTSKRLREDVVRQLRDIYLNADATLVVDAGLMMTAAKSTLDLSLAIFLSDWSSRVWTLQEGVLASKLLFYVRGQVVSLPQVNFPVWIQDPRSLVPSQLLGAYGLQTNGLNQSLDTVLDLAAGRQTSWPQDYLYGLSALLPYPPKRHDNLHLVARDIAGMYSQVDLGILLSPYPRCEIENYRWMPINGILKSGGFCTGIHGTVTVNGLLCRISASIKLVSIVNDVDSKESILRSQIMQAEFPIKHWYTTELNDVIIGTNVKGSELIFCIISHQEDGRSMGFIASQSDSDSFQYEGCAGAIGRIPEKPETILIT